MTLRNIDSWKHPDKTALLLDGGSLITYRELDEKVDSFAKLLQDKKLIFLLVKNDLPSIACYLACLKMGAVPLLLNDGISKEAICRLIEEYDPELIFCALNSVELCLDNLVSCYEGNGYGIFRRQEAKKNKKINPELALLLATSGSTGSPKLVRLSHKNLIANAESIVKFLDITESDRAITTLPFNYSYGLSVINSHLLASASIVVTNRSFMDAGFWELVNNYSVTSLAGVPYSYEILLKLRFGNMKLPSLRKLTQAGGRLSPEKVNDVADICINKGYQFFVMYGQTEATARMAYLPHEDVKNKFGSIGVAIPGGHLWIEDEQGEQIKIPDKIGELVYSGPNVSLGYALKQQDLELGDVNNGVLKTGDLARIDNQGYFYIAGRKSRFVKIFGNRISLDATEDILKKWGFVGAVFGDDEELIVTVENMREEDLKIIRQKLASQLGVHLSGIRIVSIDKLPRLNSGKIDYSCLKEMN